MAVAVDGTTAVMGATGKTVAGHAFQGGAYVYGSSGGTWSQQAVLTSSDGAANDNYGVAVAVSGGVVLVGAS